MKTAYKKSPSAKRNNGFTPPARAAGKQDLRPLNSHEQQMWDSLDRAPRSPGRPKIGQGAKNVLVSLELSLLERADNFAKQHGVGRSQLIAKAVERYLRDAIELETDLAKTAVA